VAQFKTWQIGVNTTVDLKSVAATSDSNDT